VLLRVVVGAEGAIKSVEVARSSGHSILDGSAVNAVRQWKGRPALRGGIPVETVELLPVQFKL
jgi:protein TonB